jgi:hypothetical protein
VTDQPPATDPAQAPDAPNHDPAQPAVRLAVRVRARDACEYCLLPTTLQFHIDHYIPPALWAAFHTGRRREHSASSWRRGPQHTDNFVWACAFCNTAKGQRTAGMVGGRSHRLFDPRADRWPDHFRFLHSYLFIVGISSIGRATEQVLGFNARGIHGPLGSRHDLILLDRYPPHWARDWRVGEP